MENIKRVGEGFTEKDEYDAYDISIKNLRTEKPIHPWDVKVDRSSWFGNQFKMKNESERDKEYLLETFKEDKNEH